MFEHYDTEKQGFLTSARLTAAYNGMLDKQLSESEVVKEVAQMGYADATSKITPEIFISIFENHKGCSFNPFLGDFVAIHSCRVSYLTTRFAPPDYTVDTRLSFNTMAHGHGSISGTYLWVGADDNRTTLIARRTS